LFLETLAKRNQALSRTRARKAVILVTALICVVYLLYRGIFTLNLSSPYAIFASLFLYSAEVYGVIVVLLFFLQVWDTTEPPKQPVLEGRTVDVFVPTYNEDPDLLRTTLSACVRMDYPHRTFLCDDGGTEARCKDPEKGPAARERAAKLKAICKELGVTYVTRPDNRHAKAGNVNYAFERTDGEFIIIFDADHVPEPHFITRLIGYFADEKLAFVQTPHAFYNFESFQSCHNHATNTYWEDGQLFYRVIQPGRNRWNAPIFAGSAAMFRRKALAEVGYIATETITEDMHTGLRMHAKGWKSLGISERLVAGQAAPDVTTFHTQRLRWGEGNLSIMAYNNPLTTPGLTLGQRLCYLGSMIHWAGGLFKIAIYLTPLLMLFTGVPPVNQFTWTLFGIMALYITASIWGVKYISNGQGSFWRNELFTMIGFWTQIRGTMRAILWRKLSQFVVTSKRGRQTKSVWPFVRPHFYFVAVSVLALFWGWGKVIFGLSADFYKPILATCWTLFHISLAITCIRRSLWPEDRRYSYRHTVHLPVEFSASDDGVFVRDGLGLTVDLSETGIGLIAYQPIGVGSTIRLRVHGTGEVFDARGSVVRCVQMSRGATNPGEFGGWRVGIRFLGLTPEQFDVLNRILMHYAVPRLYDQYRHSKPGWFGRIAARLALGLVVQRHAAREPYRLPFIMSTGPDEDPTFAATEDVGREAMVAVLPEQYLPGTHCEFRLSTPAGELEGTAEVMRVEPRTYAAKKYYRTVIGFTSFEGQGRVIFEDLLLPAGKRVHGEALMPMKKSFSVPMAKRSVLAAAGLLPFLLVLVLSFRHMYRDDVFLRDLIAARGQVSPAEYERLENIYASTLQDDRPSTDRLILLMNALAKVGRDSDVDRIVGIVAERDRKNLDLQIAHANAFLHSKDYARARGEYERLFRDFKTGKLPPERRREMQLALARATFHSGETAEASRVFNDLIAETPEDLSLRYEFAGALVGARQYADAAQVYDGVEPDRNGRLLLATVSTLLNKPEEAERQCDLVLRSNPDDAEAQLLKADILAAKDSTVRAEAIYTRLRRINPGDPAVRSRLAFIAMKGKDYDQALALFQQMVDEGSAGPAELRGFVDAAAGASALGQSHRKTAMKISTTAAQEWGNDAVYLSRLGWVLQRSHEYAASVEILGRAMEIDGKNPELNRQYVGALFEAGQRLKALPLLEAMERTPDNRSLLATIYIEQKKYDLAETECRALLVARPDNLGGRQQLAAALMGLGRHNEAVTLLKTLIEELPHDPDLPIRLAEALLAKGDHISALSRFVALLGSNFEQPNCWDGFINASAALRHLPPGQVPLLRKIAGRATKGDISKPEILSRLVYVLLENGDEKVATPLLEQVAKLKPSDPAVRDEIAGVLSYAGRNREALRMMEGVPPEKVDPYRLIACNAALREWAEAERLCWDVLKRNPKDRRAARWLADVLSWEGDYPAALEWFAKLLHDTPDDLELQLRVAEVTLWHGDTVAALEKHQALLEKTFDDPRIWEGFLVAAGAAKMLTPGQARLMRRIHERFLVDDATTEKLRANPLFLTRLAGGLARAGQTKDADALFARALQIAPTAAEERKNLAVALVAAKRFTDAVRLYDGLDLNTEDRFRLIEMCCAGGDFDQARERCELLLKAEPGNVRAKRWQADILSWNKDYANSLRLFRELIRDNPRDVDLKIREAEVTLWSRNHAQALLLFQALPVKTWDLPRVRRGYVDSLAGANSPNLKAESARLMTIADRSMSGSDELNGDPVFLARLGGLLARAGEKVAASRSLDKAVTMAPSDPAVRLELGGALQAADRPADALRLYDGLTLAGDYRFSRVEALAALKRFDAAIDECRAIWRLDAEDKPARLWLGNLLAWKGEHGESVRLLTELARDWADNPEVQLCLAEATLWGGESAKAATLFIHLADKTLETPRARRGLIDAGAAQPLKLDAKRLAAVANRTLQSGDELNGDIILLARLAIVLHRTGATAIANRVIDHAMLLKPKEPAERLELGGALATAGRFADAARMYEGLKLEGDNRFRKIDLLAAQREWSAARSAIDAMLMQKPNDLQAKRKLADVLSWKGDFADALRLYDELTHEAPKDEEVLVRQALVMIWSRDYPKALGLFLKLPAAARESVEARRGLVDAAAGSPPATLTPKDLPIFRRAAELSLADGDPLRSEALVLTRLGLALHRVGDKEFAAKAFDRAFDILPTEEAARFEIAGALIASGEFDKAAKLYDGLKLDGENRYRRLELLAAQKNWPAALGECRRLLTVDPEDRRALRWQADILSWKGEYPESIKAFEALSKVEPGNDELRVRTCEVLLWAKEFEKALAMLETLPEPTLQRPDLRRGFIDAAAANDKPFREQTVILARRVAKITLDAPATDDIRTSVPYLARLAWVLIKSSERASADKLLTLAVELGPTEAAQRKELGGVLGAAGRAPEALKMYEGLKLEGEDRLRLIGVHAAVKDFERAEILCRDILRDDANNRKAKRWLADVLSWKGSYEDSLKLFSELIRLEPGNAELPIRVAEVTLWSRDAERALVLFEALLEKSFDQPRLWEGFVAAASAVKAISVNQAKMVKRIRQAADKLELRSAVFWSRLAWTFLRDGDAAEAKLLLERAVALKPADDTERRELAGVLAAAKLFKEAAVLYGELDLNRDDHFRLAELSAAAEDFPTAIRHLEVILGQEPNDKKALRLLADARSWNREYPAALEIFNRLLKDDPANLDLRLRVAEVRHWSGASAEALATFEKMIADGSGDPRVWRGFVDAAAAVKKLTDEQSATAKRIADEITTNAKLKDLNADPVFLARLVLVLHRGAQAKARDALIPRIVKEKPASAAARRELAGILMAVGANAQARELYSGVALEADDRLRLIDLSTAEKHFADAEKVARALLAASPSDPKVKRKLASVLVANAKFDEALKLLNELKKDFGSDETFSTEFALATLWSGDHETALTLLEPLLAKGDELTVLAGYLDAAAMAKKLDPTVHKKIVQGIYAKAMKLDFSKAKLRQIAWVMRRLGDKESAAAIQEKLLAAEPTNRDLRFELAQTLDDLGRPQDAAKHYRILLSSQARP
jgi:tetratricopeptide (TPR) repeat protein/cellulose synthase/poly-beta-1,6-N-acetylglucosamine synthase-like glycosyltransferase